MTDRGNGPDEASDPERTSTASWPAIPPEFAGQDASPFTQEPSPQRGASPPPPPRVTLAKGESGPPPPRGVSLNKQPTAPTYVAPTPTPPPPPPPVRTGPTGAAPAYAQHPAPQRPPPPPPSAPPPSTPETSRPVWLLALLAVALVVALAGGAGGTYYLVSRTDGPTPISGQPDSPVDVPERSPAPEDTTPEEAPTPTPTPTLTQDAEQVAADELNRLRDRTLASVTPQNQWFAQLASKYVGIEDPLQTAANGTHRFLAADILAEHLALRNGNNLGASVELLLTTDYGKRQKVAGHALWVTLALGNFSSQEEVLGWCEQRFPNLNEAQRKNTCAPRQLAP